jgi:hypothetical protein
MKPLGFLDFDTRLHRIDKAGNLFDEGLEFQILDRYSSRFFGLHAADKILDATTIRRYDLTSANVHDSNVFFDELLDPENSSRDVWADSTCLFQETIECLKEDRYREHLQRKGIRRRKLSIIARRGGRKQY